MNDILLKLQNNQFWIILSLVYLVAAPVVGGLVAGLDRIISARMQKRVGPPIFQPFYDVFKLFQKQRTMVDKAQIFYVFCFMLFMIMSGVLFFAGRDLLLVFFTMTLANVFLILGAYSTSSPFSFIGAERELIQMVAYEPMVILTIVGFYIVTGSFYVKDISVFNQYPIILLMPGCFIGFLAVLVVKFQKSPYDLSSSHHPHQELVKGITTDFSGIVLGMIEIAHWYEYIFLFGFVYLFFSFSPIIGIVVTFLVFELLILVDNVFARFKYEFVVKSLWILTMILGFGNILVLYILFYFSSFFKTIF
jgi:ech hydrogenase subunit B